MQTGKIKKLIRERGFGFINATDGKEVFFHQSGLAEGTTFDALTGEEEVEFEIEDSPKGPRAINVTVVNK